jgi:histidine phosphotransfer protein HptB
MHTNLHQPTLPGNPGNIAVTCHQGSPPIWQLSETLSQFQDDGDYEWIRELIECFLIDTQQRLTVLREAAGSGASFETISAQAHTLKGSARDVGAGVLAEICRDLEQKARARETANYAMLVSQLQNSFDDLQRVLVVFRNSLPG